MHHDPVLHLPLPRLRLLGPPALVAPRALAWRDERRFRLAAFLALAGDWVSRDRLANLFWPERRQAAARSNLRKLVMELRALDLPGLEVESTALRWRTQHDAGALRAALQRGEAATWATLPTLPLLQGLEGGDSPAFDAWLQQEREALRADWRAALFRHVVTAAPADALATAQRLLAEDPLDEAVAQVALRALQSLGRPADAARLLEALRRSMADELGVEPAAATRAAAQVSAPPAAAHFDDPDEIIGRAQPLQEALALLGERSCRVLTLTGPGGVGKSALALELLRQHAPAGADSAHWVALEDLVEAAQVMPRAARELGLKLGARSDGLAEVAAALAGQQALLVLDNAEHLQGLPALLARLLAAAPALRCLVTSREPLGVAGEWLLPVEPLAGPAAADDEAILGSPAVRLFVREALAVQPRFQPTAHAAVLATLVSRLGGLPLALRLAAAWLRHLGPAALLQQLDQSMDLLAQDRSPDERPAHASIWATFEGSWQLLPPALQPVLAALSTCVGAFGLAAAQQVAHARLPQLRALAERSLLHIGEDGRCSLHPLVREFAAAKLAADPAARAAAQKRHAEAHATLMQPWKLFNRVDTRQALAAIGPELSNLLRAWDHAVAQGLPPVLDDIAPALSQYHQAQGAVAQVQPRFAAAQAALVAAEPPAPAALWRVALEHAALQYWLADYPAVTGAARVALRAARGVRNHAAVRMALNTLALAAMRQGRLSEGARQLGQALARARRDGAADEVAAFAGNLSALLRELGQGAQAQALATEALALHRTLGNAAGEVSTLNELGLLAHQGGQLDDAEGHYRQALAVLERTPMPMRRPALLSHLASVQIDQGRPDAALATASASLALVLQLGARSHELTARRMMAEAQVARGELEAARAQLDAARAVMPVGALEGSATRGYLYSSALLALAHGYAALALQLARRARAGVSTPVLPRYQALLERAALAAAGRAPGSGSAPTLEQLLQAPGR